LCSFRIQGNCEVVLKTPSILNFEEQNFKRTTIWEK
jgi:hypothetical protein